MLENELNRSSPVPSMLSPVFPRIGLAFIPVIMITCATVAISAYAQAQKENDKEVGGVISGRVTSDGQPVRGVVVFIQPSDFAQGSVKLRARTDQNGQFEIRGVPDGTYFLQAFAPALVVPNEYPMSRGKVVNLSDNEVVDNVELQLKPGGVITGRVYDVDGSPLVQENIRIFLADVNRKAQLYLPFGYMSSTTDDRGEYRIFGIPPGKYLISVGVDTNTSVARFNDTYHQMTFHPNATDEEKANVIEVSPGSESTGIDIIVGKVTKGFSVSGRIVDATTGKPIAGLGYGYTTTFDPQSGRSNTSISSGATNARGEFRIDGISPGKYAAYAVTTQEGEIYSDLGNFTITDSNVSGVVVRVHPGTSITGNVIVDGSGGPGAPRVSDVRLTFFCQSLNVAPRLGDVLIAPNGSFRITGLPRGIASFSISYPSPKGLTLERIERDGVIHKNGIEVGSGEEISDIKIILSYSTGAIRGQLQVEGGDISQTTLMFMNLRRNGAQQPMTMRTPFPDVRGRFLIEGLMPGEYEISVFIQIRPEDGKPARSKTVNQKVSVTNGNETQVTMSVDLSSPDR